MPMTAWSSSSPGITMTSATRVRSSRLRSRGLVPGARHSLGRSAAMASRRSWSDTPPVPDHDRLLAIAADLPRLWRAPGTSPRDRKRLLRTLVADVMVMPGDDDDHAVIGIRWHTGATVQVTVARYGPGRTARDALDVIRTRAATT